MALVRMDIQTLAVGAGPVPSLVVLKTHCEDGEEPIQLPIRIGGIEATCITMGLDGEVRTRPLTHDLLRSVIESLGATLTSVAIVDVHDTTFFAQLRMVDQLGRETVVDCRPSDAIALAVRCGAPLFAEQSVLDVAGMPDFGAIEDQEHNQEMQDFHEFVEGLSPDDFNVTDGGDNAPQK